MRTRPVDHPTDTTAHQTEADTQTFALAVNLNGALASRSYDDSASNPTECAGDYYTVTLQDSWGDGAQGAEWRLYQDVNGDGSLLGALLFSGVVWVGRRVVK